MFAGGHFQVGRTLGGGGTQESRSDPLHDRGGRLGTPGAAGLEGGQEPVRSGCEQEARVQHQIVQDASGGCMRGQVSLGVAVRVQPVQALLIIWRQVDQYRGEAALNIGSGTFGLGQRPEMLAERRVEQAVPGPIVALNPLEEIGGVSIAQEPGDVLLGVGAGAEFGGQSRPSPAVREPVALRPGQRQQKITDLTATCGESSKVLVHRRAHVVREAALPACQLGVGNRRRGGKSEPGQLRDQETPAGAGRDRVRDPAGELHLPPIWRRKILFVFREKAPADIRRNVTLIPVGSAVEVQLHSRRPELPHQMPIQAWAHPGKQPDPGPAGRGS